MITFFLFPGKSLQKKWKNIRDSFLRELRRVKGAKSGAAAKRKSPYVYQNLMFLKDTVEPNTTESNVNDTENIVLPTPESVSQGQPRSKKKKEDNNLEKEDLVSVLKESINSRTQRESFLEDEDRLFMLSLVKDFKKIPESAKLTTKMEIINLIHRAQNTRYDPSHYEPMTTMTRHNQPTYPRSSYTSHQEYQQGYFTKNLDNEPLATMSCRPSLLRPSEPAPPLDSQRAENSIQSHESNYSQASQDSEIIETFYDNY